MVIDKNITDNAKNIVCVRVYIYIYIYIYIYRFSQKHNNINIIGATKSIYMFRPCMWAIFRLFLGTRGNTNKNITELIKELKYLGYSVSCVNNNACNRLKILHCLRGTILLGIKGNFKKLFNSCQ
jgi:hypothetical protein